MELRLAVVSEADEEEHETAEWQDQLADELRELGSSAEGVTATPFRPDGAKGAGAVIALLVHIPVTAVAAVAQFLQDWVSRTGRTVEVGMAGDTIKISRASQKQQDQLIEAWLARHSSRT